MREDFLHYVWDGKKFDFSDLKTVCNKKITLLDTGKYIRSSGADFFNAQLIIDGLRWAGNVEIHLKSSDWYLHNHHTDSNYDNVILHVVWDYDVDVYRKNNTKIPVLQLKDYVSKNINSNYMDLIKTKSWIFCENQIGGVSEEIISGWKDNLINQRLSQKTSVVRDLLQQNQNDWEATLFCMLAKNFGLNTNGETFLEIAKSLPFSIIRKEAHEVENLEALFLGKAGLLSDDFEDTYPKELQQRWKYLQVKHRLEDTFVGGLEFFKHRPDNFPTVRLAQLAALYHKNQYFFDAVTKADTLQDIYKIFSLETSEYWQTHYVFEKESPYKRKQLSKRFIDLLIINTVIPFRFAYNQYLNKTPDSVLKNVLSEIKPEQNNIINKFKNIGVVSKNAFDTQALLQLKKHYCDKKRCMECTIGKILLS